MVAAVVLVTSSALVSACGDGALDPKGEEASTVAGLWWVLFAVGTVVFVGVLAVLTVAVRRGERSGGEPAPDDDSGDRFVTWGGIAMPSVVLLVVVVAGVWVGRDLRQSDESQALRVEVTAHQYWWDVEYPDDDVRTANELHIPVGEPVDLVVRSDDVIHSLWVPKLAGKIDLVPGHTNELRVEATEAGDLSGYCAEFCGLQHTNMRLAVTAHEPDAFDEWLAERSQPAPEPSSDRATEGQRVFIDQGCARCHRVAGTDAEGDIGPDLTHLASRPTLAAGVVDNTRGALGGWVLDPQQTKPGSLMPPTRLEAEELHALLDYLETLE